MDNSNVIRAEYDRLMAILEASNVPKQKVNALKPLIDNMAWMRTKLDEARTELQDDKICIPYDNGGGQEGIRENPLFKGYENLFKSYMSAYEKYYAALPKEVQEEVASDVVTMLDKVKAMKKRGIS